MRSGKKLTSFLATILVMFTLSAAATACTSILAGKAVTVDGSTMTAHTCDGWYDARTWVVKGGTHEPGETVKMYSNLLHGDRPSYYTYNYLGEIPQAPVTYNYFYAGYPYMNDQGVIMGETTITGRSGTKSVEGVFFIETLQAEGLARGRNAREVIQIMGALAEEYGYIDGAECLTIADGNEAWYFEVMGVGPLDCGAVWAAVRIPDDHVTVSANRTRIEKLDPNDKDNYMMSSNVFQLATDRGWYDPKSGKDFLFYEVYGPSNSVGCRRREWRALDWAAPSQEFDFDKDRFPFSVKAEWKISVKDYTKIYRDHYEGTDLDKADHPNWYITSSNGTVSKSPYASPTLTAGIYTLLGVAGPTGVNERTISVPQCSYFTVLQSRGWMDPRVGTVAWFGLNNTDTSVYVPIYAGVSYLPESFAINDRENFKFESYNESAWWAFNMVDNLVNRRYQDAIKDVRAVQEKFENEQYAMQPAIEATANALMKTNPEYAVWFLTNYTNQRLQLAVDTWWDLAGFLVSKYDDFNIISSLKFNY